MAMMPARPGQTHTELGEKGLGFALGERRFYERGGFSLLEGCVVHRVFLLKENLVPRAQHGDIDSRILNLDLARTGTAEIFRNGFQISIRDFVCRLKVSSVRP